MKNLTSPDFSAPYEVNISTPRPTQSDGSMVCIDPCSDPRWQRLVQQQPSSVFHSPEWRQVLTDTYGWTMHAYLMLDDSGEPIAGVPFCRVSDMLGTRIVTLPFSDFCDPLVASSDMWAIFSNKLVDEGYPVTLRCLHNDLPLSDGHLVLSKQARWHGLDLRLDEEQLWRRLKDNSKWVIKRAQREGITVRAAQTEEDLRSFFHLHRNIRKHKYHLLAQPYEFFANIWRQFLMPQHGVLLLAMYHEEVIGSVMFLEWKDTLYYKFSAASPAYLSLGTSELLIWEGIRHGKAKGLTALDFGLSDWDQEGLVRFKRKFATEEKAISFLRHTPPGTLSRQEQEMRSLLPQLTELLTNASVPDQITDRAGELLYRFFV